MNTAYESTTAGCFLFRVPTFTFAENISYLFISLSNPHRNHNIIQIAIDEGSIWLPSNEEGVMMNEVEEAGRVYDH